MRLCLADERIDRLSPAMARALIETVQEEERRKDLRAAVIVQAMTGVKPWEVFTSLQDIRPLPETPEELEMKILAALGV